jgi:hypothetical protein
MFVFASAAVLMVNMALGRKSLAYQTYHTPDGLSFSWKDAAQLNRTVCWTVAPGAPEIVRESMLVVTEEWRQTTGGALAFSEGTGGVTVLWDSAGTMLTDEVSLACTTFDATGHEITTAKIVINATSYDWQRNGVRGVGSASKTGKRPSDLDAVLLHELGHALGLDHSDRAPAAVVGAWGPGDLPTMNSVVYPGAETLHMDDEAGIRSLYCSGNPATTVAALDISASPSTGVRKVDVAFTAYSNDTDVSWDFGDGSIGSGANTTHWYTAPGTYVVTARNNGKMAQCTIQVDKKKAKQPVERKKKVGRVK